MKVIDLLNKIANGEEVPEKIRFEGVDLRLEKDTYYCSNTMYSLIDYIKLKRSTLNEEVEIIEEEPEIDIQGIEETKINDDGVNEFFYYYNHRNLDTPSIDCSAVDVEIMKKINELIKAVKYLDNKIKEKE